MAVFGLYITLLALLLWSVLAHPHHWRDVGDTSLVDEAQSCRNPTSYVPYEKTNEFLDDFEHGLC